MIKKPLEGVVVIDMTRVLAGPYCGAILADLGADVIKVEMPGRGDDGRAFGPFKKGESLYFMSVNRGKKSITLNLKSEKGKQILKDLVKQADVLVENFRGGTMAKLGLDYTVLKEINPRLIYTQSTGYGRTGSNAKDPAYDVIIEGRAGMMSVNGFPDQKEPLRIGIDIADIGAAVYAAIGTLAALLARQSTGKGQLVDVSMLDCQIALLENAVARYMNLGIVAGRLGNVHPSITPFETFETSDNYMNVAIGNDKLFKKFCDLVGAPEMAEDERYKDNASRTLNEKALHDDMEKFFLQHPTDYWIETLEKAGIPVGAINTIDKAVKEKSVLEHNMLVTVKHPVCGDLTFANFPVQMSETPGGIQGPPPVLGQHTREILSTRLGYTDEEIDALYDEKVL
jgi:CoA:oxalate CoA-transferase